MSLNVWQVDNQTNQLADIIQAGGADIVGLQEMNNTDGVALANALGWHYELQSGSDTQVISRFPVVGLAPAHRGVQFEISPGHNAWLFNAHLPAYPYQPYDVRDNPSLTEAQLIASAESARGNNMLNYLSAISAATTPADRVFLTGDFNEPSHLDWTAAAANATVRPYDKQVAWPASEKVANAGFLDSFRTIYPDEIARPGYTWTPGEPPGNVAANEVHDRIDFVYSRGPGLTTNSSQTVGLNAANPNTDIAVAGYNTDHRGVVSDFTANGLQGSTLTFSRLTNNPGNDSALNAAGSSFWDTYDGDQDRDTNNNWNVGVAQLQSSTSGTADFDLEFMPDIGTGVIVNSFDMKSYADYGDHTINWELWSGSADTGTLLASNGLNPVSIDDGETNSLSTGWDTPEFGKLTLRIQHLSGAGDSLAIDNVSFRQIAAIPEPAALALCSLAAMACLLGRFRNPAK